VNMVMVKRGGSSVGGEDVKMVMGTLRLGP
jgi:hypothetical protein